MNSSERRVSPQIYHVVDSNDKPQPPPLAQKWLTVFEKKNIKYMPNNKVVEIDGANKQLVTDKGDKIGYDLLTLIPSEQGFNNH